MRKMICFTGQIDSPFFLNEIEYIKKNFDILEVLCYPGNLEKYNEISKQYNFKYSIIENFKLLSFFSLSFLQWIFNKETLKEIKKNVTFNKIGIKRLMYILLYGNFCINMKKKLKVLLIKENKEEILLYSYWLTRGAYSFCYFKELTKDKNISVISRAHGYDLYQNRNQMNYLPFRNYIIKYINKIFFISQNGKKYFINQYGLEEKYFVSRLGTKNKLNLKKKIKPKTRICIASCSSVIQLKRLDLIIDVLSNLKLEINWIHIGNGEKIEEIKKLALKRLKDKDYIFLGNIPNGKILDLYLKYDVDYFINLSDSEGIPVSIMEAISLGIPCIARDVGGISEIVNNETGLLMKNVEYEKIENFLKIRLGNIEEYKKLSKKTFLFWEKNYCSSKNYSIFLEKLREN